MVCIASNGSGLAATRGDPLASDSHLSSSSNTLISGIEAPSGADDPTMPPRSSSSSLTWGNNTNTTPREHMAAPSSSTGLESHPSASTSTFHGSAHLDKGADNDEDDHHHIREHPYQSYGMDFLSGKFDETTETLPQYTPASERFISSTVAKYCVGLKGFRRPALAITVRLNDSFNLNNKSVIEHSPYCCDVWNR